MFRILLTLGILAAGSALADPEVPFRMFTLIDGRSVEARISDYRFAKNPIQIERPNGQKGWVDIGNFIEEDQKYVHRKMVAYQFSSGLGLSIKKKLEPIKNSKDESISYELTLQNRTRTTFEEVWIEYRIYVEEEGYGGNEDSGHCFGGCIEVGTLPPGKKMVVRSAPERLVKQGPVVETLVRFVDGGTIAFDKKIATTHIDQPKGAWFRLCMSMGGIERPAIKDAYTPSGLNKKVEWHETPKPRGARFLKDSGAFWNINFKVGSLYQNGYGDVPKDISKAIEFYEKAAAEGEAQAFHEIGNMYNSGRDVERDYAKAVAYYEKAFNAGYRQSASSLAYIYRTGRKGVPKDEERAFQWFVAGAEKDDMRCLAELAWHYGANEDPSKRDAKKALHYANRTMNHDPTGTSLKEKAAAGYARAGRFYKAIMLEEDIIGFIEDHMKGSQREKALAHHNERLDLYRHGKAWPSD